MKITAALCWYDEPIETLERCVRSVAVVADRIVAYDGAYARWPGAKVRSNAKQAAAIRRAAKGMECEVVIPKRLWAGQVEKRAALMAQAAKGSDWVLFVDADHELSGDRDTIRAQVAAAKRDVLDASFFTPTNPDRPLKDSASHTWHVELAGQTVGIPTLYRALPDLTVESFHWFISATKNGKHVWLGGGQPEEPHGNLPGLLVTHRCLTRDSAHVLANRAFCNDREMVVRVTGQEDDRPNLPRPVFEYDRLGGTAETVAAVEAVIGSSYR